MTKKDLENRIRELESENFDLERALAQAKMFEQIGEERLVKAMKKMDKYLLEINEYRKNEKE